METEAIRFTDAVNILEKRAQTLHPKMPGVFAMGVIGRFHGEKYDQCINDLDSGEITITEYFSDMMKMISEYEEYLVNKV